MDLVERLGMTSYLWLNKPRRLTQVAILPGEFTARTSIEFKMVSERKRRIYGVTGCEY